MPIKYNSEDSVADAPARKFDIGPDDESIDGGGPLDTLLKQAKAGWTAADDLMRIAANGATRGGADALAAYMEGKTGLGTKGGADVAGQKAATAQSVEDAGSAGSVAHVAGAIAPELMIPGAAVSSVPRAMGTGAVVGAADQIGTSYFDDGTLGTPQEVIAGSIFGAAGGGLGAKLGKMIQKPALRPALQAQADILAQEGIDITAGQATRLPDLLKREGAASQAWEFMENQKTAFSRAVLRRIGVTAPLGELDSGVIESTLGEIGQKMDVLARRNPLSFTVKDGKLQVMDEMRKVIEKYADSIETGKPAGFITKTYDKVRKAAAVGQMDGTEWQEIMSSLRMEMGDGSTALNKAARDLRLALNKEMERSIAGSNPSDLGLWQMANREYKNALIVQEAASRTSKASRGGTLITPENLAAADEMISGTPNFTRDKTDFSKLAKAGKSMLVPLPVADHANGREIARLLTRATVGGAMGQGMYFSGASPATSVIAGTAGALLPDMVSHMSGKAALRPLPKLVPEAGAIGARAGIAGGTLVDDSVGMSNPFVKAMLAGQ